MTRNWFGSKNFRGCFQIFVDFFILLFNVQVRLKIVQFGVLSQLNKLTLRGSNITTYLVLGIFVGFKPLFQFVFQFDVVLEMLLMRVLGFVQI